MTEILKKIFTKSQKTTRNSDISLLLTLIYTVLFVFLVVVFIGSLSGSGEGLKIFEFSLKPIASESANAIYVLAGAIITELFSNIKRLMSFLYKTSEEELKEENEN